jgi:hypothetical protein
VATVTLVSFEVTLKYPHGNPAVEATDHGNMDSDEANVSNEFTFSSGTPAILRVPVEAEINPASEETTIGPWLSWTIDTIAGTHATWTQSRPGDIHTGTNSWTTAEFTMPSLPGQNSDFGTKSVQLAVDNIGAVGSTTIEVFYPRDATNHPGGDQTRPGSGSPRSPNWYYYWGQGVFGGGASVFYDGTLGFLGLTPAGALWRPGLPFAKDEIWIGPGANGEQGAPQPSSGIDFLRNIFLHEARHVEQIADADALLGDLNGLSNSIWTSGWSWSFRPHNHWRLGGDGAAGYLGIDDDNDGEVDEINDNSEIGTPGSDDVNLDVNDDDVPDSWGTGGRAFLEAEAESAETNVEDTFIAHDWANPGKQHNTRRYDN